MVEFVTYEGSCETLYRPNVSLKTTSINLRNHCHDVSFNEVMFESIKIRHIRQTIINIPYHIDGERPTQRIS